MAKKSRVRKRFIFLRRMIRLFIWIIGIILFFLIGLYLYITTQYPAPRMLQMISEQVDTQTDMPLQISDISWRFPVKLAMNDIRLGYAGSPIEQDPPLLVIRRFEIHFRLFPLLKRRFHIQSLTLEDPAVILDPDRFEETLKSLNKKFSPDADDSLKKAQSLPMSFALSRLRLRNFNLTVLRPDHNNRSLFKVTGLNLNINDLVVPRNISTSIKDAGMTLELFSDEGQLIFQQDAVDLRLFPRVQLKAGLKNDRWNLKGLISLAEDDLKMARLNLAIRGEGMAEKIRMDSVTLELSQNPVLHLSGLISGADGKPEYDLVLRSYDFNIKTLPDFASSFLPSDQKFVLDSLFIQGTLQAAYGFLRGNDEQLLFKIESGLDHGRLEYNHKVEIDSLFYHLKIDGSLHQKKNMTARITGGAGFSDSNFIINDTTAAETGPLKIDISALIDSTGLPVQGHLAGSLQRLFDANAAIEMNWGRNNPHLKNPAGCFADGFISVDSLELSMIPGMTPGIRGKSNIAFNLSMPDCVQAIVKLKAGIPHLSYRIESFSDPDLQLYAHSAVFLKTSKDYQQIRMDSCSILIHDLISGAMKGQVNLKERTFGIDLRKAELDLGRLLDVLPVELQNSMAHQALGGKIGLSGKIRGSMDQPLRTSVSGTFSIQDALFSDKTTGLEIRGMDADLTMSGIPASMRGKGRLSVRQIKLDLLRSRPLEDSRLEFEVMLDEGKSLFVSDGLCVLDSLYTRASFGAVLTRLDSNPEIKAEMDIDFSSESWTELVQKFFIRGNFSFHVKTAPIGTSPAYRLSGLAVIPGIDIQNEKLLNISKLSGRLPFQIDFDSKTGMLISDNQYSPSSWILYESRRSQFRSLNPDQGSLSIEQADVSGYQFKNLAMDIDIHRGHLQIPWFLIETLNGNVGGNISLSLGTGKSESIAYEIHAQAARINSEALSRIKIKKVEETELDATLAFKGRGIDPNQDMDIDGYFHITKIGPQFASSLLEGLDPQGEDRNIRMTQRLLNMGWKPKLFSFEMRHGYVYPSLSLSQPWFSPIRLPGELSFGRLPLKFFMDNPNLAQTK